MNYCKDCRWSDGATRLPYCLKPDKPTWAFDDPVSGAKEKTIDFCMHQRQDYDFVETCGSRGKWFESKRKSSHERNIARLRKLQEVFKKLPSMVSYIQRKIDRLEEEQTVRNLQDIQAELIAKDKLARCRLL